jgi:hypothetical protein
MTEMPKLETVRRVPCLIKKHYSIYSGFVPQRIMNNTKIRTNPNYLIRTTDECLELMKEQEDYLNEPQLDIGHLRWEPQMDVEINPLHPDPSGVSASEVHASVDEFFFADSEMVPEEGSLDYDPELTVSVQEEHECNGENCDYH